MKPMERLVTQSFEQEENIAKVERFLEGVSARYRDEGIPVGSNGRIDMTSYEGLYPDVKKDLERNRDWEKGWFGNISEGEIREKRRHMEGEQLEMLAYAIFAKNLGDEFVVARASPHDDRKNKVDTVILNRKTGGLICAFDEIGDAAGGEYEKKIASVTSKNLEGGASLKYGIGVRGEKDEAKIVPCAADHLPLFYLAVPRDRVEKGMKEFVADPVRQSEFEERLFSYFLKTISAQISGLDLYRKRLNPELKQKMEDFRSVVDSFNAKQAKKEQ